MKPLFISMRKMARGFTLIELLIAISIFTILAALAYGSYNTSVKQTAIAREKMARLEEIQTAVRIITQDFEQLEPRPVRDVLGDGRLPALQADPTTEVLVSLTRGGWSNPIGLPRSTLQRVTYTLVDGTLRRDHWTVLDATLANEPMQRDLLTEVKLAQLRYMDGNQQWQEQWPPTGTDPVQAQRLRPIAAEIILELEDAGQIRRVVEIAR